MTRSVNHSGCLGCASNARTRILAIPLLRVVANHSASKFSTLLRSSCSISFQRDQAQSFASSLTTPSQTRKRKATDTLETAPRNNKQNKAVDSGKVSAASGQPNTPPLTTMDSDDEFMSGLSSQDGDFGGTQESDDGSLGEG